MLASAAAIAAAALATASLAQTHGGSPPPPKPEHVVIETLPLPPTVPSNVAGACTSIVNPRGTGCMSGELTGIVEGPAYTWDSRHVLLPVVFAGAPAAGSGSGYSGPQVIAVRRDGGYFPNGDAWKCITCGIAPDHRQGAAPSTTEGGAPPSPAGADWIAVDHPQAFPDDRKMIAGTNVFDCGPYKLTDSACTPDRMRVYPIRWNTSADGSGAGGSMRELRLNPDGVHLMWSNMTRSIGARDQNGLIGRLTFNGSPRSGEPRVPRYELAEVTVLTNRDDTLYVPFRSDPKDHNRLIHNPVKGTIGEARGWTRDGRDAVGMGFPESGNVDIYITSLTTGASHRLTSTPGYADPVLMAPDDRWLVVLDNRVVDRHMYYSGMQGIPPLVDLITRPIAISGNFGYRNGLRRFFQPILIDRWGDRGNYVGQQLNAGPGTPGSPSDPNWNARADPAWAPDGTNVVYWQALVTAPACGGTNPLACPVSTEPGERRTRLMIARLPSRKALPPRATPPPGRMTVPWGTPYRPGDAMPARQTFAPAGKFTMRGSIAGTAQVEIRKNAAGQFTFVSAKYAGYSDDGVHIIDGTESAERAGVGVAAQIVWHSDLRSSGQQIGTKRTSEPGGFVISPAGEPLSGDLVTTIAGKTYRRPPPGT